MAILVNVPGDIKAKPERVPPPIVSSETIKEEVPQFRCVVINKTDEQVKFYIGSRLAAILEHDQRFPVEMFDARAEIAAYREIVFEKDGSVTAKINRDWTNPYESHWCVELINNSEVFQTIHIQPPAGAVVFGIVSGFVSIGAGLRRLVPVDITDELAKSATVEWKIVRRKSPISGFPQYLKEQAHLEQVRTPRSDRELAKLIAERKERLLAAS